MLGALFIALLLILNLVRKKKVSAKLFGIRLPKLEREILLVTLKEHRNGGITLQNLAEQVRVNQKTVLEKAEELIRKGILRKFEDNDQTIIDSLWVV